MFNIRYVPAQRSARRRSAPPTEGFGRLGLGQPSTLWLGQDQTTWPNLVTRYGFPWSLVLNAPGSLTLDNASWSFGTDTNLVVIGGGGLAVKVGLECSQMASGSTTVQYDFTWSCPIYWPAVFGTLQVPMSDSNGQLPAASSRSFPSILTTATMSQPGSRIAGGVISPPSGAAMVTGFNTTLTRRGLYVATSQVRLGQRVWQVKIRTTAATFDWTSAPIVSVAAGLPINTFTQGYMELPPASYASSNLGFGGACCWKGIGASDAQLTAILDNWATLYPLS